VGEKTTSMAIAEEYAKADQVYIDKTIVRATRSPPSPACRGAGPLG
jgi:hypothetical protein